MKLHDTRLNLAICAGLPVSAAAGLNPSIAALLTDKLETTKTKNP